MNDRLKSAMYDPLADLRARNVVLRLLRDLVKQSETALRNAEG